MTHETFPLEEDDSLAEQPKTVRRPLWKRLLKGLGITVILLAVVAGMLYEFGSMAPADPAMRAQYAQLVASGAVKDDVQKQFHIPIPGCKCHSTDPVLTMQHSTRRISQCSKCHGQG